MACLQGQGLLPSVMQLEVQPWTAVRQTFSAVVKLKACLQGQAKQQATGLANFDLAVLYMIVSPTLMVILGKYTH